ncbi:hypothetical protein HK099_007158 [Clydaea vesicula]|uniref:Uncharacterized protein n=1 Tax=Clydaea vesicula TaxID=447962 RepID=A0AAD5U0C3_9FUNG|nr:hypothetical protein HK099_007158 [Clydaea vesicula]
MNETEYLLALQDWNQKTSLRWPLNNVAPSILAILILIQLKPTLNRNLLLVSAIAKIETGIVYLIFTNLSIFKGLKGEVYGVWGYLMVGLCTPGWLISETSIVLSNGLRCFYICGDQKYKKVYKISAGILIVCEIFWRIYGATFSQISDDVNKPNAVIAMINTFTWGTNAVADLIICIRILWFTVYQLKCSSVQKSTKTIYKVILHVKTFDY